MKKILAYLLVLVSLMTLFCGTASADTTFTGSATQGIYVDVTMTNLDNGVVSVEKKCAATWRVTATCKYEGNNPLYPVAAWASNVSPSVGVAGGSTARNGEPHESTQTFYEGGKRSIVEHYYTCSTITTYAPAASKRTNDNGTVQYLYGNTTSVITKTVNTIIRFYRR